MQNQPPRFLQRLILLTTVNRMVVPLLYQQRISSSGFSRIISPRGPIHSTMSTDLEARRFFYYRRPSDAFLHEYTTRLLRQQNHGVKKATFDDVVAQYDQYEAACAELNRQLRGQGLSGPQKHELHCRHRFKYGRQPNVCRHCWSYQPICICNYYNQRNESAENCADDNQRTAETYSSLLLPERESFMPSNVDGRSSELLADNTLIHTAVVVWTHHKEWGSPSNTGSVLNVALNNDMLANSATGGRRNSCIMLMKGLPDHDKMLSDLLQQEAIVPVVLWTKEDESENLLVDSVSTDQNKSYICLDELTSIAANKESLPVTVVLIAIEGTWTTARKMAAKLPRSVPRLHLRASDIFGLNLGDHCSVSVRLRQSQDSDDNVTSSPALPSRSRLHSLRKQKSNSAKVCTAEAVVSALVAMTSITPPEATSILHLLETKVRRTIDFQGKTKLKLGISPPRLAKDNT
jgi:DTW domain-containing protein YfiP